MKRSPPFVTPLFHDVLEHMKSLGYKEGSMAFFAGQFRRINLLVLEMGCSQYSSEVYHCFMEQILDGRVYSELAEREKRKIRAAGMLFEYQETGRIPLRHKRETENFRDGIKSEIETFLEFRRNQLLAESTVALDRKYLMRFNAFLNQRHIEDASEITHADIHAYIQNHGFYAPKVLEQSLKSLRHLFLYLYDAGKVPVEFLRLIPKYTAKSGQKLPTTYTLSEIDAVLNAINRADPLGKRNYAAILIAARLGLRSSDICSLKFSEIFWDQNKIVLAQKKTGGHVELPLLNEVGNAIIDYLKYGRPESESSYIFLKHMPPYDMMTGSAFYTAVKTAMRHADIEFTSKRHGPHALRHSLASILLEKHTPIPVISSVLGHQSTETTKIYLRIDITSLRECALPVPALAESFYEGRLSRENI